MSQTPKQRAANQVRSLNSVKAKLQEMGNSWADEDEYLRSKFDGVQESLLELQRELIEFKNGVADDIEEARKQ